MTQLKILVDTNTYLRLARTIHPLLGQPFGNENYCLYIISELNHELGNTRLSGKFSWVFEAEFAESRSAFPQLSRKEKQAIAQTFEYIWDFVLSDFLGPSRVDVKYLAVAYELGIPVVSDDQDMLALAKEFEIETLSTIELLKLMHDAESVSLKTIKALMAYWEYEDDRPANMKADFKRLFD